MTHRATQQINSRFGTYMPGDVIDEAADVVIEAWVAAGIAIADTEEAQAVAEPPKPVEKATRKPAEKAVSRRQVEPPHRRFVAADDKPTAHKRFQQET